MKKFLPLISILVISLVVYLTIKLQAPSSDRKPSTENSEVLAAPVGFALPVGCAVSGAGTPMIDQAYGTIAGFGWSVDCGSANNVRARDFLAATMEASGWKFCGTALPATAYWWKNGTQTVIADSTDGTPTTFGVSQSPGEDCSS